MWSEEERWVKDTERKQRPDIAMASEKGRGKERKGQERRTPKPTFPAEQKRLMDGVNRRRCGQGVFSQQASRGLHCPLPDHDMHVTAVIQNLVPWTTPLEPIPGLVSTQMSLFGQNLFRGGKPGGRH